MERHQPLRRTRLRAKARHEAPAGLRPVDFRAYAIQRARSLCECGCGGVLIEPVDDHHIFYRSHVSRRVRDEFWNRALIRQACHIAIHDQGDVARRQRLEWKAVNWLLASLSGPELAELVASIPPGATDPSATVETYERMRRGTQAA